MAIVIDEVVISIEVAAQGGGGAQGGAKGGEDKQALLQECVERVLEILETREER